MQGLFLLITIAVLVAILAADVATAHTCKSAAGNSLYGPPTGGKQIVPS